MSLKDEVIIDNDILKKEYSVSFSFVWEKLSKAVNRTFIHVDQKLNENKNWFQSMKCDLNDL